MLREAQSVRHHCLPDPLSAEVVEARLIARLRPRYNRAGTRADRYCYVRLDVDSAWPRLAIVKDAAAHRPAPRTAAVAHDGRRSSSRPCRPRSRCGAARCASAARHQPPPDATPCAAAQMGVAACPCAGLADRRPLRRRRRRSPSRRSRAGPTPSSSGSPTRMTALAAAAALRGGGAGPRPPVGARRRDQAHPPDGRPARPRLVRDRPRRRHVGRRPGPARRRPRRRLDRRRPARRRRPTPPIPGRPLPRTLADEALVLARKLLRPASDAARSRERDQVSEEPATATPSRAIVSCLVCPSAGSAAASASASAGSHSRQTVGPLPDSQPHHAPASSPAARAVARRRRRRRSAGPGAGGPRSPSAAPRRRRRPGRRRAAPCARR